MSHRYDEILIQCDTREQSALLKNHKTESAIVKGKYLISDYSESELYKLSQQRPRISSIYNYFSAKGAEVGIGKLDRCDYAISGYHRDQEINLGVEFKTVTDLMGSMDDLPWKLWESSEMYRSVGLFIEGKIDIEEQNGWYFVRNYGGPNVLRYDLYQARIAAWNEIGIHVRQFDKLDMFPVTLDNLLDYITKSHAPVHYRNVCDSDLVLQMLSQVPGFKIGTISKLLKGNPNMSFAELNQMEMKELQDRIGKKTGEKLWRVLHGTKLLV